MSKNLSDIFPPTEIGGGGGGIEEAPKTGKMYARKDAAWEEFATGNLDDGNKDGEILTWDTAAANWTHNDKFIVFTSGTFQSSGSAEVAGRYMLKRASGDLSLSIARYWDGINGTPLNGTKGDILAIGNSGGDGLVFANGDVERVRIHANGDVSTSENLRIQNKTGGVGAKSELTFVNSPDITGQSGRANIVVERVASGSGGYDSSTMTFSTTIGGVTADLSPRMTIDASGKVSVSGNFDASGRVGIGTDNPQKAVHIHSDTTWASLYMTGAGGNALEIKTYGDGANGSIIDAIGDNPMRFFTNGSQRAIIDTQGRVGIGGTPSRSTKEIEEEAEATLRNWDSKDKKPTKAELIKQLTERTIGGGDAKLQVSGGGYFSGIVNASALVRPLSGMGGITFNNHNDGPETLPTDNAGIRTDGQMNLGRRSAYRYKNAFLTGDVYAAKFYGKVTDVPDHVKAITPTQIANWDAGTGGGGGGATTDGRISDTQIIHWDQAYSWGNHANAGYQPAGSYATTSDLSNYVPKSGNTTISGTLTATDFVATSDERLKQNATTAPVGLVDQLRGVEFEWKEDGRQDAGVIAQEVEKVLPHLVHDTGEHKAVNYNGLVAYLIEEIKDLKAQVEALK